MPTVNYLDPAGVTHSVDVPVGRSLMEGAVANDVPGVMAECGGNLACATCHVYIDAASFARIGPAPAGSLEDEMLDHVRSGRQASSRLSCQVIVGDGMDGIVVHVAPSQA
jgi:2Fe-2S ferredoxin